MSCKVCQPKDKSVQVLDGQWYFFLVPLYCWVSAWVKRCDHSFFKTTDPEYLPVTFCFLCRVVFNLRKCLKSSNITFKMVPITEKYLHSVKEQGRRDKIFLGIS